MRIKEYLPNGLVNIKKRNQTDFIVVTCTDTKPDKLLDIVQLDRLHRALGWVCVGCHYLIDKFGEIQKGRELEEHGCHTWGYDDTAVCVTLVGGRNLEGITTEQSYFEEQLESLVTLIYHLKNVYPDAKVVGQSMLLKDEEKPYFDVEGYVNG